MRAWTSAFLAATTGGVLLWALPPAHTATQEVDEGVICAAWGFAIGSLVVLVGPR